MMLAVSYAVESVDAVEGPLSFELMSVVFDCALSAEEA